MKFVYTDPKAGTATVTLAEGDAIRTVEDAKGNQVIKLGIGKSAAVNRRKLILAIRKAVRLAREHKLTSVAFNATDLRFPGTAGISESDLGRLFAENAGMANYDFTRYKTDTTYKGLETVHVAGATRALQQGVEVGAVIAESANHARNLSNTPGGDMTPELLAEAAKVMTRGTKAKVTVLNLAQITKLKMGMVLGVSQGAEAEPKFIIVEYWGTSKSEKPVVLVGKGVTFDSGGLSVKPADSMHGMHQDMSGGAAVLASIAAIAKLKLKKNVVALVPAVENAIGGNSYRPGDILTAIDGTTVEVLNTDAEGRLILGDALAFAERYNPRLTVDVATLTGAVEVALGNRASGLYTTSEKLESQFRDLGERTGDYLWPLPLWEEYHADIKGTFADLANLATSNPRKGGSITAARFLAHFARKLGPWVHIDMASRDDSIPSDNLAKGATGEHVRLLVRAVEEL